MARPESTTSARVITAREREQKAVKMRLTGATFEDIGAALEITASGAYRAVKRSLQRVIDKTNEDVEQARALDLQRIDRMLLALWPMVLKGDVASILAARALMQERAKLLGLYAPVQAVALVETRDADGRSDTERVRALVGLVAALRAGASDEDTGGEDAVEPAEPAAVAGPAVPSV